MAFINASSIQTNELLLNDNSLIGSIYSLDNNVYFKNSEDITYKLNTPIEPIYIINENIGISTESPRSKLEILSQCDQLQLSYSCSHWCKFHLDEYKTLSIDGQSCIDFNHSSLINVKYPCHENDAVNKKYVDDHIGCSTDSLLHKLCQVYSFVPSNCVPICEIEEQICLRKQFKIPLQTYIFAVSSEYYPLCVKNDALTIRVPANIFITEIRASLTKVAVGCSGVKFNIEQPESHCKLLKNDFYIPPGYKAETLHYCSGNKIFNVNQIADNEELVVHITQVGDVFSGSGLKITLIGL
jgi:hypothetical protein